MQRAPPPWVGSRERLGISLTRVYMETVQWGVSWGGYLAPREVGAGGPGPGLAQVRPAGNQVRVLFGSQYYFFFPLPSLGASIFPSTF